ncbi:MAG TPA: ABC transporter ATP-binding protein [Candidatus Dormibacteraeota bacterium]|nr:ABC transporter ATP-binding protein [Candidatus Dormibacteraeota bacterium]
MEELVIETRGLTKRYGSRVVAVDSVDMSVRRGEVYGFLGPNGAGKTTTLRILVGLIRPDSGTARVVGHEPGKPAGLARIGTLIEYATFYPYLSGRDNLKVVADYAGVPYGRIDAALDEVDLRDAASRRFGTYSTGMKQRLGVAAALLKKPELLILDEPTNGLDPQGMAEMRMLIRHLGKGEHTVLVSSHMLGEVEQICDRVGVISHGRLVRESSVRELRGSAAVLVRARPSDIARQLLTEMFGPEAVGQMDGALRVSTDPERSADLNTRLAAAGVVVSELRPIQKSLEEVFFQLTGEEQGS